jgi:hypothetical protein
MLLMYLMVLGHAAAAVLLSWGYFRRYAVPRPPVSVFSLLDIAFMLAGIILVPFLYLLLPVPLVVVLIASGVLSLIYLTAEPVLRTHWAIGLLTLLLVGADVALAWRFGAFSPPALVVNNVVLVVTVVGVTNLWAQSGMRGRDLVVLGLALVVYDYLATWHFSMMSNLFARLGQLPLMPMVAWRVDATTWMGLGLGDVLLAAVFPLVMRKAFSRTAGLLAMALGIGAIAAVLADPLVRGAEESVFPVMIVLGPLMALQYAFWQRRCGAERTTRQYLEAEPAA